MPNDFNKASTRVFLFIYYLYATISKNYFNWLNYYSESIDLRSKWIWTNNLRNNSSNYYCIKGINEISIYLRTWKIHCEINNKYLLSTQKIYWESKLTMSKCKQWLIKTCITIKYNENIIYILICTDTYIHVVHFQHYTQYY